LICFYHPEEDQAEIRKALDRLSRNPYTGDRLAEMEDNGVMDEFLFYEQGRRRDQDQIMHDILTVAKKGRKKSKIMVSSNIAWKILQKMFSTAIRAELIEEVEKPGFKRRWNRKPILVWKSTEKGLKYAQIIYDSYKPKEEK